MRRGRVVSAYTHQTPGAEKKFRRIAHSFSLSPCLSPHGQAKRRNRDHGLRRFPASQRQFWHQRGIHHRTNRVQPVLRFIKHDRLRSLEHLVAHFHAVQPELVVNVQAHRGVQVVEGRQTVHEHRLRRGGSHQLRRDAIGAQRLNALAPHRLRLAHGDPHIRVQHMRALHGLHGVALKAEVRAGLRRDGRAARPQLRAGHVGFRGAGHKVHPHFRAAHHQRVAHVVARVA